MFSTYRTDSRCTQKSFRGIKCQHHQKLYVFHRCGLGYSYEKDTSHTLRHNGEDGKWVAKTFKDLRGCVSRGLFRLIGSKPTISYEMDFFKKCLAKKRLAEK